jgi:N-acetyl sugar amidotransferase
MDTSDPEIIFNNNGFCNHCEEFINETSKNIYKGEETDIQLKNLVNEIKRKGKNSKYDCLIGVSGGVDSSYVAYLTHKLGLRTLAVHLDNGWNSEEAVLNIKNLCNKLKIDYSSFVLDWEEFRDIQLSVLRSSIVEVEIPTDIAILGALHKTASKHNIKYIISGGNFATEGILPEKWFYDPKDLTLLKAIHKTFGKKRIKNFPYFDFKKEIFYKFFKGIKMFYLLNYIPYEKDKVMDVLKEELDWKYYGGKHYESKFTGFVQSYYQYEKFNLDYRRATFSTQICTGEMKREDALKELNEKPYSQEKINIEIDYVSKKLGIEKNEFSDIFNSPVKSYKDYPNDEKKLKFIYSVYRKLFS